MISLRRLSEVVLLGADEGLALGIVRQLRRSELINSNDNPPSERTGFADCTCQTGPPAATDDGIPALFGAKGAHKNFKVRPELSPPGLELHLSLRR